MDASARRIDANAEDLRFLLGDPMKSTANQEQVCAWDIFLENNAEIAGKGRGAKAEASRGGVWRVFMCLLLLESMAH